MPTPQVNDAEIRQIHVHMKERNCSYHFLQGKSMSYEVTYSWNLYENFQCYAVICMKCATGGS